ncbi:MAG: branched-chain amino acid ABC transporter permease [Aeromicrobium sp.]|uniref:branched-chain amino acid ABC transporter permease n=1 Tax=Aeromicrobium sp. TaxID=1871063 RepID=UPI0025C11B89|nr:branched-chain amino acid ABC transporter permease [Aeromicrobium sp.]MCK5890143.1 branched-chain amino acid ABC transporter permease [Aeromicrobium sp.]MDF1703812.1 branched-chain amino acid ABC transporter permease [Aeromicrobium sp.]
MTGFLTAVSGGLGQGAIYVLLALGFVIIYKSMKVVSFAQPAFMMAGAILVSYLTPRFGFAGAVIVGTISIGLVALAVERIAIRPMVGKAVFVIAIITIGVDIVVRVVAGAFVGTDPLLVGDPWGLDTVSIGDVQVQQRHIAALVAMIVVVVALMLFFRFSSMGLAMRAAALDQEAAMAQGVSVGAVFALSWALAGGLAALAGVFAAAGNPIDQTFWVVALAALPVIIVGGLDSLGGAVVAGLLVGVVESLVRAYHNDLFPNLATNTGPLAPYVLMMVVLLVRPHGLFGTKEVERV